MKKVGSFFRALVPFIIALVLMCISTFVVMILTGISSGFDISMLTDLQSILSQHDFLFYVNITYAVLSIIIFGIWYRLRFVRPFKKVPRNIPKGFSLRTILALVILAFGLQLSCSC